MTGQVHQGDVNGVPAFWVDSGRPTLTASLIARQGMVDETLPTTGWTHLLEHLALHDRASGALHVNGSVSLLHTRFDAHGPADRVAEVLSAVSRWLAEPTFDELAREQSVLRAEAAVRGLGDVNAALLQRYGANGPGLAGYAEPGLSLASADRLRDLAHRAFVVENCALFLDGPPPPGLTLALHSGSAQPIPPATACGDTLPAAYIVRSGLTLSGVVARSVAATFLPHVFREVLTTEFRERDGGAYAPWSHYEPVDAGSAVVLCGSDATQVLLRTLASRALSQVGHVARGEFPTTLVADVRAQLVQAFTDPYNLPGLAYRAATDHLRGEPPMALEEAVAETEAVTCEDVVAEAAALRASLLMGIDGEAQWDSEVPMLAMASGPHRFEGRSHRSRNFPANRESLVVSDEAVQIGVDKEYRTVRRDQVAGLFAYPDGAREVVARDGWSIRVEPTMWAKGAVAARDVDAMVPETLHIPMLERDPGMVPRPASLYQRLRYAARQFGAGRAIAGVLMALVVMALVWGVTVATGEFPLRPVLIGLLVFAVSSRIRSRKRV